MERDEQAFASAPPQPVGMGQGFLRRHRSAIIMVLAILSLGIDDELQRLNAVKVVLTGLVNLISGLVFVFAAHVAWGAAGLIAAGSLLGGAGGARAGRRLSPTVLRAVVVVVGVIAIVRLVA